MSNCKGCNVPIHPGDRMMRTNDEKNKLEVKVPYRELIGSLIYVSRCTRPDIAFVTSYLSQFNANPEKQHWEKAKQVLRYLKMTKEKRLTFEPKGEKITGYCDADWGTMAPDRKSYTGYVFYLSGGAVTWKSCKQKTVALSTAEAEFMALVMGTKEALWLKEFIEELNMEKYLSSPFILYSDNQSAKEMTKHPVMHESNKHISIKYHFIRDNVNKKKISVEYLPSEQMKADILTKPLPPVKIKSLRELLGII